MVTIVSSTMTQVATSHTSPTSLWKRLISSIAIFLNSFSRPLRFTTTLTYRSWSKKYWCINTMKIVRFCSVYNKCQLKFSCNLVMHHLSKTSAQLSTAENNHVDLSAVRIDYMEFNPQREGPPMPNFVSNGSISPRPLGVCSVGGGTRPY